MMGYCFVDDVCNDLALTSVLACNLYGGFTSIVMDDDTRCVSRLLKAFPNGMVDRECNAMEGPRYLTSSINAVV